MSGARAAERAGAGMTDGGILRAGASPVPGHRLSAAGPARYRPLRILHVLDHSVPLNSGYARRTLAILREQRARGWQTFQVTGPRHGSRGGEEAVAGWYFYRTPPVAHGQRLAGLREAALMRALEQRLEQVVHRVRPDLLHAHSPVLDAMTALRVGRRRRLPVVYEVPALWEDAAAEHGRPLGGLRHRAGRALETWALRRAAAVTTPCEGLRRDLVERGIDPARITVVPNAVDAVGFQTAAGAPRLRQELGLGGARVLGFIGSLHPREGLDLLLEALPAIRDRAGDVRVLLVGDGPHLTGLRARAHALGLAGCVVFAGTVPQAEVPGYYDLMDLAVYPRRASRLAELVSPLKPLEAMARGRAVVASDVGGHRELVREGVTGLLFRAGDAGHLAHRVVSLLHGPEHVASLTAAARRYVVTERDWRPVVARYAEVYRAAIGAGEALIR